MVITPKRTKTIQASLLRIYTNIFIYLATWDKVFPPAYRFVCKPGGATRLPNILKAYFLTAKSSV